MTFNVGDTVYHKDEPDQFGKVEQGDSGFTLVKWDRGETLMQLTKHLVSLAEKRHTFTKGDRVKFLKQREGNPLTGIVINDGIGGKPRRIQVTWDNGLGTMEWDYDLVSANPVSVFRKDDRVKSTINTKVGNILTLFNQNGLIRVIWDDGTITQCSEPAIELIGRDGFSVRDTVSYNTGYVPYHETIVGKIKEFREDGRAYIVHDNGLAYVEIDRLTKVAAEIKNGKVIKSDGEKLRDILKEKLVVVGKEPIKPIEFKDIRVGDLIKYISVITADHPDYVQESIIQGRVTQKNPGWVRIPTTKDLFVITLGNSENSKWYLIDRPMPKVGDTVTPEQTDKLPNGSVIRFIKHEDPAFYVKVAGQWFYGDEKINMNAKTPETEWTLAELPQT